MTYLIVFGVMVLLIGFGVTIDWFVGDEYTDVP